ncbi:MAG TPA: hypothetical protein VFX13_00690 [Gaiellales bacterium]|jgi:hypothetical protein|nr:hypothetical protein [Gaiellales bacterium]
MAAATAETPRPRPDPPPQPETPPEPDVPGRPVSPEEDDDVHGDPETPV